MPVMATTADNAATALRLAHAGFAVFPCQPGGAKAKQPMPFIKWREASTCSEAQIRQWWQKWPDAAIGLDLAKSGLIVIDADRHDHDGVTALGDLMASHGYVPDGVPLVATPNEGTHFFYRQPAGRQFGNGRGTLPPGVDVRGHGGYVIAPGTVMQDGRLYEVFSDIADAPELPAWLVGILEPKREAPPAERPVLPTGAGASEIEELLSYIPADCGYHDWLAVLMALHAAGASVDLADQWSATGGAKYPGSKEIEKKWRSFKRAGISSRTLAMIAERHGADLAAIAIRHNSPPDDGYDTRKLLVGADGTLADAETGEIVEAAPIAGVPSVYTDYPPGLVGMIAQWIVDTARRPQPELSIGAALAIVGTVAGRQFCGPTRSGTHLYVLGLAPTGTGKDHPLQAIGRIMSAAKLTAHLGPSEFISMPAVVNFLTRRPLSICAMDEFGGFMKRINSKRASGFEGAISKVIRTMWSTSFAPYATPEWAQKESQMIFAPAMSMYGASTPEQFYSAMEGASIEDGTLNRFLLLNGQNGPAEVDPEYDASRVPVEIVRDIGFIYGRSGDMSKTYRNDAGTDPAAHGAVIQLPWCADGAHKRYKALTAEVERIMRKEPESAAFYARAAEMALRIATIVAIGRLEDEQVRLADLEFGIGLAMTSSRIMAEGAADYMSENENQSNAQKVMRIIKSRGGRCAYRDLLRSLQSTIKARDLKDLLTHLCDAGQLERQEVKPVSGPSSFWYQAL
jgi:hypothetical protein